MAVPTLLLIFIKIVLHMAKCISGDSAPKGDHSGHTHSYVPDCDVTDSHVIHVKLTDITASKIRRLAENVYSNLF